MDKKEGFDPYGTVATLFPNLATTKGGGIPIIENFARNRSAPEMDSLGEFEQRLGIPLEHRPTQDNLCMANNPAVRPEFLTSFEKIHVLDYIYAVLHSKDFFHSLDLELPQGILKLPYPVDLDHFWKLVEIGGEIRKFHMEHPMSKEDGPPAPLIALAMKVDAIGIYNSERKTH